MLLNKSLVALIGVFFLVPLHAEQAATAGSVANDSGQETASKAQVQAAPEPGESVEQGTTASAKPNNTPVDPTRAQRDEAMRQRYEAARAKHQQRVETRRKQQDERVAEAEKSRKAQLDARLKQYEERQQQIVQRHETMRNRAEEEHNYLIQHNDEMLEQVLQSKIDVANRHETMRKQADERRKKLAAFRAAMEDMTAEERREYLEKSRDELFGSGDDAARPRGIPAPRRYGAMHRRPPPHRYDFGQRPRW